MQHKLLCICQVQIVVLANLILYIINSFQTAQRSQAQAQAQAAYNQPVSSFNAPDIDKSDHRDKRKQSQDLMQTRPDQTRPNSVDPSADQSVRLL